MKDPKRWLDPAGGAGEMTRGLLARADDVEPPAAAKDAVWAAMLAAGVIASSAAASAATASAATAASAATTGATVAGTGATVAGSATVAAGTAAAATGTALTLKMVVIGAVIAAGSAGGVAVMSSRADAPKTGTIELPATTTPAATAQPAQPPPSIAAPPAVVAPPEEEATAAPFAASAAPPAANAAPPAPATNDEIYSEPPATAPSAAPPVEDASGASAIAEEARLLRRARQALRAGDPARALALVGEAKTRFPRGRMVQEAEAIAIEALARSGARDEARRRLDAFEREHPDSAHVTGLREEVH